MASVEFFSEEWVQKFDRQLSNQKMPSCAYPLDREFILIDLRVIDAHRNWENFNNCGFKEKFQSLSSSINPQKY